MRSFARLLVTVIALALGVQPALGAGCDLACREQTTATTRLSGHCAGHHSSSASDRTPSPASPCGHDHRVSATLTSQVAAPLVRADWSLLPIPILTFPASPPTHAAIVLRPDRRGHRPSIPAAVPLRI
jgi:hypothetical protein